MNRATSGGQAVRAKRPAGWGGNWEELVPCVSFVDHISFWGTNKERKRERERERERDGERESFRPRGPDNFMHVGMVEQ